MSALHEVKRAIVDVCRKIDAREYVGGRDGNVSVLASNGTIVVTPAGIRKGDVTADDLLVVDRRGAVLQGRGGPSTETLMHLRIYDLRSDVRAVVHAHPPVATGFAAAGVEMNECILPEVIVGLGRVPITRYATPGTPELSSSLDPLIAEHDAYLLANHGVVTVGADVVSAHHRLETVEQAARILLVARLLGGANPLGPREVRELIEGRSRYGVREGLAGCELPEAGAEREDTEAAGPSAPPSTRAAEDELVERIVGQVLERLRG